MNVGSKTMSRGKIKTNALVKVSLLAAHSLPVDLYRGCLYPFFLSI